MNTTPNIYIPPSCKSLKDAPIPQIRLGIQGPFGCGKTHAAVTFPNPIVLNLDRGLGAHVGREDIIDAPFYDNDFVDSLFPRKKTDPPNRRDAILKWLRTDALKLVPEQTLIVDGLTGLESSFDTQEKLEPVITATGQIDTFAFWRHKVEWFSEVTDLLISLKCNVVLIAHEQDERAKNGTYTGKVRPLLTGQYADKLGGKFTDWFRMHCADKPKDLSNVDNNKLSLWGFKTSAEYKSMCDSFSGNSIYFWQTEGDDMFDAKRSSLVNAPRFIPANFESFCKFRRKKISS